MRTSLHYFIACMLDGSCDIGLCKERPLSNSPLKLQLYMNAAVDEAISLEFLIYSASRPLPASKQSSKQICTFRITNKKRHDIPIECCSSLQVHVWWRCGMHVSRSSSWLCGIRVIDNSRSVDGTGRLRSHLLPPGAVGALYGSGCFHFSRRLSVSSMINCGGW